MRSRILLHEYEYASNLLDYFLFMEIVKVDYKKRLGSGGFGKVYETCIDNNCKYATKVLYTSSANDQEFNIATFMGNWGIGPRVYQNFLAKQNESDKYHIVMDKLPSEPDEKLKSKTDREQICKSTADKIKEMHNLGFIHCDLYDRNIRSFKVGNLWKTLIFDFGEAMNFHSQNRSSAFQKCLEHDIKRLQKYEACTN